MNSQNTHHPVTRRRILPGVAAMALAGAVAVAGALGPSGAQAAEDKSKPEKEMSLRERYALPTHIQMLPMMVPIRHRYQSVSPISLFLEADRREEVGAICRKVPRIRDAILQVLSRRPIPTQRGRLVLSGLDGRLIGPINAVLGETGIKSIHIEPGAIALATKGGISRLPFASINGCKGIKEIELERVKAEQKAKE